MIMSKIIKVVFTVIALSLITSCENPAVDVYKDVNVTVNLSSVISSRFSPYSAEDFSLGSANVKLTCLLYNSEGSLEWDEEYSVQDFNSEKTFAIRNSGGGDRYKLIVLASCYEGSLSQPSLSAYKITGIQSESTLKVEQMVIDNMFSMLGYAVSTIDKNSSDISLDMQPATALVYCWYEDVHANNAGSVSVSDLYGKYTATATDFWNEDTYTWTISVERDAAGGNALIVKDFDPLLLKAGWTSSEGYNTYKATYKDGAVVIPQGQLTGYTSSEGKVCLMGGTIDGGVVMHEDVIMDAYGNSMTTRNMFGIMANGGSGWINLFNPGVSFVKNGSSGSAVSSVDEYMICFRCPNVGRYDGTGFVYTADYPSGDMYYNSIRPSEFSGYDNIYSVLNYFPGTFVVTGATGKNGNVNYHSQRNASFVAGHQYAIRFNCRDLQLTVSEGTRASSDCSLVPSGFANRIKSSRVAARGEE